MLFRSLCGDLMRHLEDCRAREAVDPQLALLEQELQSRMQLEARERIDELRAELRRVAQEGEDEDDDDFDDDDFEVEVEYRL